MSTPEAMTLMVALQFALYGVGWAGASIFINESKGALRLFSGFVWLVGAGMALLAARGRLPDVLTYLGAGLCLLAGYVALSLSASRLLKRTVRPVPQLGVPLVAAVVLMLLWFNGRHDAWRVSVLNGAIAWVAGYAAVTCVGPVRREFGLWIAAVLALAATLLGVELLRRQVGALLAWDASLLQMTQPSAGNLASFYLVLAAAGAVNFAVAGLVLTRVVRRLDHLSRHDVLTELLNRRAWMEMLGVEWQRHRRYGGGLAVIALDIDHFKRINDQHGHAMGDVVLARLGHLLRPVLRRTDQLGRIGGEEFGVLLLDADEATALRLAERMRLAVAGETWPKPLAASGGVTVSLGVAVLGSADADLAALLARADAALYAAKAAGRDRVRAAVPEANAGPAARPADARGAMQ